MKKNRGNSGMHSDVLWLGGVKCESERKVNDEKGQEKTSKMNIGRSEVRKQHYEVMAVSVTY